MSSADLSANPAGLTAYLGRHSQQESNPNEVNRTLAEVIIHPDYKGETNENDIALLKLSSPVTFTAYIAPVCLAASGSSFYSGVECWVTGWGNIAIGGERKKRISRSFEKYVRRGELNSLDKNIF